MTHAELFALIAQNKEWRKPNHWDRFDTKPDTRVGGDNLENHTLILEGNEIIVLDTEGQQHTFTLRDAVTIG